MHLDRPRFQRAATLGVALAAFTACADAPPLRMPLTASLR